MAHVGFKKRYMLFLQTREPFVSALYMTYAYILDTSYRYIMYYRLVQYMRCYRHAHSDML